MTVKQLRQKLELLADDMKVIVVSDHGQWPMHLDEVERSYFIDHGTEIDVLHSDDADGTEEVGLVLWA